MEASFHTESRPGNNNAEGETVDSQAGSAGGPPPGFSGQQQLQGILGQTGPGAPGSGMPQQCIQLQQQVEHEQLLHEGVVPGRITPEKLRKGRISPEQLRAGGISQEQLWTGEILPEQLRQGGILSEQLTAGDILLILPGQLRPSVVPRGRVPAFGVPSQDLRQMQVSGAGSTQQLDLSALAALSRQGEVPGGQELMGTINADDLEASVHTKSSPGNNILVGEKNVDRQAGSADRSGGGQHKQKILGPQEHDQIKTTAEKYSCQNCNKIFSSLYWFQNHTILCGHPLPCEKCNKTFKNLRCLNKHIKVYHGHQFKCLDCGECFATEKKLRVHGKKTHVQICPWCKVESKNIRALRKHVKKNCKGKKPGDVKQFEAIMSNDSEVDRNEKVNAVEISSSKKMEKGKESLSSKLPTKVQNKKKYLKSPKQLPRMSQILQNSKWIKKAHKNSYQSNKKVWFTWYHF